MNPSADQGIQTAPRGRRAVIRGDGAAHRRRWTGLSGLAATGSFAAATQNALPLYHATLSEQTAAEAEWLTIAETLAERHGGEIIIIYTGGAFPEALRLGLAAYRWTHAGFAGYLTRECARRSENALFSR